MADCSPHKMVNLLVHYYICSKQNNSHDIYDQRLDIRFLRLKLYFRSYNTYLKKCFREVINKFDHSINIQKKKRTIYQLYVDHLNMLNYPLKV